MPCTSGPPALMASPRRNRPGPPPHRGGRARARGERRLHGCPAATQRVVSALFYAPRVGSHGSHHIAFSSLAPERGRRTGRPRTLAGVHWLIAARMGAQSVHWLRDSSSLLRGTPASTVSARPLRSVHSTPHDGKRQDVAGESTRARDTRRRGHDGSWP